MLRQVAGKALELTVLLGLVFKKKFKKYWKEELNTEMRNCWEYVLENIREHGVNCIFGIYFSRMHWLDENWTKNKLDAIFNPELWDEVWGTYVSWGRPSPNGFKTLVEREKYGLAVEKLGQPNKFDFRKNPEEGLVEHIMIGYFNGWIELNSGLLEKFFEQADPKLRRKAARFLTTGFKAVNEKGGQEKEKVAKRMKAYWEKRLEAIKESNEEDKDEAIGFTLWVHDTVLDSKTTFELLERTLDLTDGKVSGSMIGRKFFEKIHELGKGNELSALRCIKKFAGDKNIQMMLSIDKQRLLGFLEDILQLTNDYPEVDLIRKEALEVADAYGRIQPDTFRNVWEKLRNYESANPR